MTSVLSACSSSASGGDGGKSNGKSGGNTGANSPKEITLLQPEVAVAATEIPLYVGEEKGFWAQYGIKLNVVKLASTQAIPAYLSKDFQFGMSDPGTLATLVARKVPVNLFAIPYTQTNFGFWVTPDIKKPSDLIGKAIGISKPGGSPYIASVDSLVHLGIDPKKVTFVSLGSSQDIVTALITGHVKAGSFGAPASTIAKEHGLRNMLPIKDTGKPHVGLPILGSPSWVKDHKSVAINWLKAYIESEWYSLTHKDEIEAIAAKKLNFDPTTAHGKAVWEDTFADFSGIRDPADLGDNQGVLQSIKDSYQKPEDIESMDVVNPTDDLMKQIVDSGFLKTMEQKYGPLPKR